MALTIVEYAKSSQNEGTTKRDTIVELYARNSDILAVLPFTNIDGDSYAYNQEDTLPGVAFRGVNESFTATNGVINPEVETLSIAGGEIDVDVALIKTHGRSRKGTEVAMKVKALSASYTNKFIKGDSETEVREFDGLQKRLTGDQSVSNSAASGGAGLSLAALDESIDAVDNANYLLMTKSVRRRLTAAARDTSVGGYITYEVDQFGRQITKYNDLPILLADRNGTQNPSLGFNETYTGGGTANGTSVYVLQLEEGMLTGLQNGGIDVRDFGEISSSPVERVRVDWMTGLLLEHPRAGARLRDISDSAVTV